MSSNDSPAASAPSPLSSSISTNDRHALAGLSISEVADTPMQDVRRFFRGMSDSSILEFSLGMDKAGASELAKHTIVIIMDCEKFEYEPRCLTEYGLHSFTRAEMAPVLADPGPHGENLLRAMYYYHVRLLKTAHYINRKWCPGNPEHNRFGVTRFATDQQAKDFLTHCIAWPIDDNEPNGGQCPVVLLGHAVSNDLKMLQDLGVDPSAISNVVAIIDTQQIAKEKGIHGRGNEIGLASLMSHYSVAFRDSHTAGNDAAYTMIAALQMVMGKNLSTPKDRSLQDVVDDLEGYSESVVPDVGIARYCTRCAATDHNRPECYGRIKRCETCLKAGHKAAAYTHITKLCTHP